MDIEYTHPHRGKCMDIQDIHTLNTDTNSCSPTSPPSSTTCPLIHFHWRMKKNSADSGLFTPVHSESVNECTVRGAMTLRKRTNTDSVVINERTLGPEWWDESDTTAQNGTHSHRSSFSGGTKCWWTRRRLIRREVRRSWNLFQKCECLFFFLLFFFF